MEVRDGFIVGIFNYCGRWCERCALTHRRHRHGMKELLQAMNEAASAPAPKHEYEPRPLPSAHLAIEARARGYCLRVHAWLRAHDVFSANDPGDPRAAISWFHTLIPAKIYRALLGIERSHSSWLDLVERGLATHSEIAPLVEDLVWLTDALERVFPNARAFVRPALDEPDEVAMLLAEEGKT